MKPHHQITIIPNRHRAHALGAFRQLVELYFQQSERDTEGVPLDWEGATAARSRINQMLPRIMQMVRATGLTNDPGLAPGHIELFQRIFDSRHAPGAHRDIFDIIDMARGVYDGDQVFALARTINPFHYAGALLAFLARAPRAMFTALGLGGGTRPPAVAAGDITRLEAAVSRLANIESLIEHRFAELQGRQAMRDEEHSRQMIELAERLDFAERVLVQQRAMNRIDEPQRPRVVTPV